MKKIQSLQPLKVENTESKSVFEKKEIPLIKFNLSGLENLEDKIKGLKLLNYQHEFVSEMNKVLSLYELNELKYNYHFVLFVMNEAERFILKRKSGEAKNKLVTEVCKKYFNDDEEIVQMIITLLFNQLKQVKFLKRQGLKLIRFFLKVRQNRL